MSMSPALSSLLHEAVDPESLSTTSHKCKHDSSDESGSEDHSSDTVDEGDRPSKDYTSRRSICQLQDLLEEMKTLPESSERSANIKNLGKLIKAVDSYDWER